MRKLNWLLFLLILSFLSYFREILFLGINEAIDQDFSNNPYSIQPDYFINQPISRLIKLKYALTALFSLLFAIITIGGLKQAFRQNFPFIISLIAYSMIFGIAIIIGGVSIAFNSFREVYPFLRGIIEYLHNPFLFLLFSATVLAIEVLPDKDPNI
jgi:hypothetical protein